MAILLILAIVIPFIVLALSQSKDRRRALGAASSGMAGSALLVLFGFSGSHEPGSEPHLEALGELVLMMVAGYGGLLLIVFVVAFVAADRRTRARGLPHAVVEQD